MGDRTIPIKFGPEWLRNLSHERIVPSSVSGANTVGSSVPGSPSTANSGASVAAPSGVAAAGASGTSRVCNNSKVLLAKLRYGREEMLALYDRSVDAPSQLKQIDILYQPRGKPPFALHNSFEEETREPLRSAPSMSTPVDRYGMGRGRSLEQRSMQTFRNLLVEQRGRGRGFVRQTSLGNRGANWHTGAPRNPYQLQLDDEVNTPRLWNNSALPTTSSRSGTEHADWSGKPFKNKRQGHNTNWRQQPQRDEGDEWRGPDLGRSRGPHDKWVPERDWNERSVQDKSWNNRRTWNEAQIDDALPEWAVDNTEACGGTFDSSGAFHGYSNDDTNIPKAQEPIYQLSRSHTHGSFARSKNVEEGSDEWWASEKAKKLSPKRFDYMTMKFQNMKSDDGPNTATNFGPNEDDNYIEEAQNAEAEAHMSTTPTVASDTQETSNSELDDDKFNKSYGQKFTESNTFDSLLRNDINLEEATDERGNFQSVMIAPNNILRQKHQNMVQPGMNEGNKRNTGHHDIMHLLEQAQSRSLDIDTPNQTVQQQTKDKLAEEFLELSLGEDLPTASMSSLMSSANPAGSGISYVNSMAQVQMTGMHTASVQPSVMQQPVGITNSVLNASLGLPIGSPSNIQMNAGNPVMPSARMTNPVMMPGMQGISPGGMSSFQSTGVLPGISNTNVGGSSLFLGQNPGSGMIQPNDVQLSNHGGQNIMYPLHGLQQSPSQGFNSSIYGNIMPPTAGPMPGIPNMAEQWYYEDPKKTIQGPFSSKEMLNWYRAGFFNPTLMVRRACEASMRPLGTYGPMPFGQFDYLPSYPISSYDLRSPSSHDLNNQPGLGIDVEALWSQPQPQQQHSDLMWIHAMNANHDARLHNMPMYFWDQQPAAPNNLHTETISKEMRTEDQILAQMRASQGVSAATSPETLIPEGFAATSQAITATSQAFTTTSQTITTTSQDFTATSQAFSDAPVMFGDAKTDDVFAVGKPTPDLEELQKLLEKEKQAAVIKTTVAEAKTPSVEKKVKPAPAPASPPAPAPAPARAPAPAPAPAPTPKAAHASKQNAEPKQARQPKETEKPAKKENTNKNKKKAKEDKKEEVVEPKPKEEVKEAKRPATSPANKKETSKKELEKEKKEWLKDGFTIVKTSEKHSNKDKKKAAHSDENRAAEEAERKKKEAERHAAEEEKKRRQDEAKKQQDIIRERQVTETIAKKAPWSAIAGQAATTTSKDGLTLSEIQRLEREKKLEQIKEQQHMMQLIADQQAAALAREQEMQAGLGWAKKKNNAPPPVSLTDIQAEARKQSAAAALVTAAAPISSGATAASTPEEHAESPLPQVLNNLAWGNTSNGGFWDAPTSVSPASPKPEKHVEFKPDPPKNKKKQGGQWKKDLASMAEFEAWCISELENFDTDIDVPTFVGFLKDIDSPFEVKDYVKYYLGENKNGSDFSRDFLEKRSKILRSNVEAHNDDLCSPATAVNPRTSSATEYQEVKKGKKSKKNKMQKVDSRILGFSCTAAEDRINIGDIDTA